MNDELLVVCLIFFVIFENNCANKIYRISFLSLLVKIFVRFNKWSCHAFFSPQTYTRRLRREATWKRISNYFILFLLVKKRLGISLYSFLTKILGNSLVTPYGIPSRDIPYWFKIVGLLLMLALSNINQISIIKNRISFLCFWKLVSDSRLSNKRQSHTEENQGSHLCRSTLQHQNCRELETREILFRLLYTANTQKCHFCICLSLSQNLCSEQINCAM